MNPWIDVRKQYPNRGEVIEIKHFGHHRGHDILDSATVDEYGICPDAKDGGHGKRSTVTHWRPIAALAGEKK